MKRNLDRGCIDERDYVLFHEDYRPDKYSGGIRRFEDLSYRDYEELLYLNVIDPDDRQNLAPTAKEIAEFLRSHPDFRAHGYAVSPERGDYRVSLEGVCCTEEYSLQDVIDFFELFKDPDEIKVEKNCLSCWYD